MSLIASFLRYLLFVVSLCLSFTSVSADGLNPQTHPAANEVITVGEPYTIEWSPGTPGNVSIWLKSNPDWKPQNITLSTENTGTYTWTPEASLASDNDGGNYFLQICEFNSTECTYTFAGRFNFTGLQATSSSSVGLTAAASATSISSVSSAQSASTVLTQTTSASSSITSSYSSTSPTSASSSAAANSSGTSSRSLSTTAKIAIAVVLSISGTIALLLCAFWLLKRRRRSKTPPIPKTPIYEKSVSERRPELHDSNFNRIELPITAPARLHELETPQQGSTGQP